MATTPIKGYAFKDNNDQIRNDITKTWYKVRHLQDEVEFEVIPDYKRTKFKGTLPTKKTQDLTAKELLVLLTDGRLPFGGKVTRYDNEFEAVKYTS